MNRAFPRPTDGLHLHRRTLLRVQQLDMFLHLMETGSVRVTGDTVGLTQSAVSKSLKELESILRVQLFHRTPSGLQPTEAARVFARFARQAVQGFNAVCQELESTPEHPAERVTVGASSGAPYMALVKALRAPARHGPALTAQIVLDDTAQLLRRLCDGEISLGLMFEPNGRDELRAGLRFLRLGRDRLHAVTRIGHPVLHRPDSLHVYPWLVPRAEDPMRIRLHQALERHGVPRSPQMMESDAAGAVSELVLQGDAIAWCSDATAAPWVASGTLAMLPLGFDPPSHAFGLARLAHRPLGPACTSLWRRLLGDARAMRKRVLTRP